MPAEGLADITITPGSGAGLRIAVVSASWNPEITDRRFGRASCRERV